MNRFIVIEAKHNGEVVYEGKLSDIGELFNDTYNNLLRSNKRKALYRNRYNIVKENEEYIGFTKAAEYAVADVEDNELIEYIGLVDDIVEKYGIEKKYFANYASNGNLFNKRYRIFRIED